MEAVISNQEAAIFIYTIIIIIGLFWVHHSLSDILASILNELYTPNEDYVPGIDIKIPVSHVPDLTIEDKYTIQEVNIEKNYPFVQDMPSTYELNRIIYNEIIEHMEKSGVLNVEQSYDNTGGSYIRVNFKYLTYKK